MNSQLAAYATSNLWLIIIGMGIITFLIRLSMIVLLGNVKISDTVMRGLRYVPPAVLSAIIFPEMLQPAPHGVLDISLGNARLVAGLVAIATALISKNMFITIGIGIVTMWIWPFIIG